jgi:hypothetical protein
MTGSSSWSCKEHEYIHQRKNSFSIYGSTKEKNVIFNYMSEEKCFREEKSVVSRMIDIENIIVFC